MKKQKLIGSYYTPDFLAEFVVDHLSHSLSLIDNIDILEPSVGDGIFIKSLKQKLFLHSKKNITVTAIEKYKTELKKTIAESKKDHLENIHYNFYKNDFLKVQKELKNKYSCIIGNPPYIKKRFLNKTQIELGKEIHKNAGLAENIFKNIWSAFLIRCSELLSEKGILAFVLPSELLQVKFSQEIRSYLITHFERIEIFTFDELIFNKIGQDTVLLFCFKKHAEKGQYFVQIKDKSHLKQKSFKLSAHISFPGTSIKWTNHILSSDEIELMYRIKKSLNAINFYCESKPGIVTAANDYFIINGKIENEYDLKLFTTPIIKKGFFVNGSIVFNKDDYEQLLEAEKPSKLIVFGTSSYENFSAKVKEYIQLGYNQKIPNRYKCAIRDKWYVVPNIGKPPDGFFFKRSHYYPKLLINKANVLVTDSAYKINMRDQYSIQCLVYSFYNSLTLAFAEMEGRYYGQGVLELTPNEFKELPVPFLRIGADDFKSFQYHFEDKISIKDLLNKHDEIILASSLNISSDLVERIQKIYNKLINKRFRNS